MDGETDVARWLPADAALAGGHRHVWRGVAHGRLGRCDLAWEEWGRVREAPLAPWVAAEQGRLLREFGLHDEAERVESTAFETCDDVVVRAMLAIGLTADAVGRNDASLATERLAVARGLVGSAASTPALRRQRLRLAWVAVEVALITGREPPTEGLPAMPGTGDESIDWPEDHVAGTDFHRAKGLLFSGIVHNDDRLLRAALPLAPPILTWAIHLARHDVFGADAVADASRCWRALTPPPGHEGAVASTSVGRRLG